MSNQSPPLTCHSKNEQDGIHSMQLFGGRIREREATGKEEEERGENYYRKTHDKKKIGNWCARQESNL